MKVVFVFFLFFFFSAPKAIGGQVEIIVHTVVTFSRNRPLGLERDRGGPNKGAGNPISAAAKDEVVEINGSIKICKLT